MLKAKKASLGAAVAELKASRRDVVMLDRQRLRHQLRATLKDLRGLLCKNVPQTRQILRKLLEAG